MARTLLDGINYLRTSILDDTGGSGIDWSTINEASPENHMLRWSNEELAYFINEAWKQVARRLLCYRDGDRWTIKVKAGIVEYPIDSKIIQIIHVESQVNGKELPEKDYLEVVTGVSWRGQTGYLKYWMPEYNTGVVRVYPTPSIDDTLYLVAYHLPLIDLTWDNPDQVISMRDEWFNSMMNYAAYLAYLKDEANSKDEPRANMFLQMFNQEFPQTSAYSESRRRKTTRRGIKYGGIEENIKYPGRRDRWL